MLSLILTVVCLASPIDCHLLAAVPKKKPQGALLQENLKNGTLINLSDGSLWEINPSDTPITQSWITAVEIKVEPNPGNTDYPYKLTNTLTGSSVQARKPPPKQNMAPASPSGNGS